MSEYKVGDILQDKYTDDRVKVVEVRHYSLVVVSLDSRGREQDTCWTEPYRYFSLWTHVKGENGAIAKVNKHMMTLDEVVESFEEKLAVEEHNLATKREFIDLMLTQKVDNEFVDWALEVLSRCKKVSAKSQTKKNK